MLGRDLLILITFDPRKNLERASLALAIATAAQVSGSPVSLFFAQDGVYAAVKDSMRGLVCPEFAPLEEMMTILRDEGAKFHVCHPFLGPRGIRGEDLREGVRITSAVSLVQQGTESSVLTF